ncbi:Pyrrolopyrazine biosynthesis cluster protein F [Fulvia fulva]|uniref:Pyrrolopyrazine biosynthesis cluster protein F n=1 Tax=Passalora fulva TaxID=5499 RepID=A0A9Q8L9U2_PASFU|nr:Pyrrolopyrazine biosynthesis cluster protein F [Fulvia fulva]KAK4631955.1 Pyrrolopyrazine biosynthesis cluster protein F [Fulvia fulva]UJO13421.1 Pyrrolopyrazine biosynthesis cluster protein F [Fulvia fulva]WPV11355.1 Pyrrolopyrazine biosynthesis cluster protein F [Fulvia fulva]WPV25428.1 Pyrrolopyrazine biosynthesis cluster protein F [Fulvia fulva]
MSNKPVFVATHPRACSTAFERVFMTRRNTIHTVHEPCGDAYYYGPERMGSRFEGEEHEQDREKSGFSQSTFKSIFDRIVSESTEGKRTFIKDMAQYYIPEAEQPPVIAPSLHQIKRGVGTNGLPAANDGGDATSDKDSGIAMTPEASRPSSPKSPPFPYEGSFAESNNPTVVPREMLEKFHWTFLIRHPSKSIPSYYRCCIPPLVERTKFSPFMPKEAGYHELRRLFDYLKDTGLVGPKICGQENAEGIELKPGQVEICVLDADDMLDDPEGNLRAYCESIGVDFSQAMLNWDSEESHAFAKEQFEKWNGFHDDAINSTDLKPRQHKHAPKSDEQLYQEWIEKYGQAAADVIKETVDDNVADYEYLKQYAIQVPKKA